VVQLLQNRDLSVDPVQRIRRRLVPVRSHPACRQKDGVSTNTAPSPSMSLQ
jgi:hypothetical protein